MLKLKRKKNGAKGGLLPQPLSYFGSKTSIKQDLKSRYQVNHISQILRLNNLEIENFLEEKSRGRGSERWLSLMSPWVGYIQINTGDLGGKIILRRKPIKPID